MRRARGFTLIELMIAISVGLFLIAGLLIILQNVGRTHRNQNALAQLQDSQRVAMTLIGEVVEAAGYFPDPTTYTLGAALPSSPLGGATLAAGQALYGTRAAADPGDTLTVRFATTMNDTIINCVGGTNTTETIHTYVNTFSVKDGQLQCSLDSAAAVPLISGLKRMDVLYGVKRLVSDDNNVDTYVRADVMTAADWSNVSSVRVKLTFENPLKGSGQPPTVVFSRTIAIMGRAGVKI
jgi:type IV pilus assembly protein PilW